MEEARAGMEMDDTMIDASALDDGDAMDVGGMDDGSGDRPHFPALSAAQLRQEGGDEFRRIPVPPHRYTPLKESWAQIFTPIAEHMKLQIRMNTQTRQVELKTSPATTDPGALQKSADFIKAFMLGFSVQDAVALLRLDDLYLDSFDVTDVKPLHGEHLSRAIGRVAGKGGKTKFTIENVTTTRIVLADTKVHILGAFQNIRMAKDAIANLILGSPPGKVYGKLHTVAGRALERS